MAFQKNTNEYDLILHNDTNCKGSTQWFNFSVTFPRFTGEHVPSNFTYKFNIVNLVLWLVYLDKSEFAVYKGHEAIIHLQYRFEMG